ncbi:MAG TPA: VanZ family protein [Cellvibrionaceae bacterium]
MNMPLNKYAVFTLFMLILIAGAIFSADTGYANAPIQLIQQLPLGDKWTHAILYGSLAFGLGSSFMPGFTKLGLARAVLCVGVFTFVEEFSQYWFPLRTVDAGDLVANVIGLSIAHYGLWRTKKAHKLMRKAG